jgi:hypothetical protein
LPTINNPLRADREEQIGREEREMNAGLQETPTTETGNPAIATARSMVGDASFAFPTTPTNETSRSEKLVSAAPVVGGVAS